MEESTIALLAVALGGAYAVKKKLKKAPLEADSPDIPDIIEDIEDAPSKALTVIEEEEKIPESKAPAKNPIQEAVDKIVYQLSSEDQRKFQEFGIIKAKMFSQVYREASGMVSQIQARIANLEEKLKSGDYGPSAPPETLRYADYIKSVIANGEKPFRVSAMEMMGGYFQITVERVQTWKSAWDFIHNEGKRIVVKDAIGFGKAFQLASADEKTKLRNDYFQGKIFTTYSNDYSKEYESLIGAMRASIMFWELKNYKDFLGKWELEQAKYDIQNAENRWEDNLNRLDSILNLMGDTGPELIKAQILSEKDSLKKLEFIVATGDKLMKENFDKTKYIKYLKNAPTKKYDPDNVEDLEKELARDRDELADVEVRKNQLTEQEYTLVKNFYINKVKLLEKILKEIDITKLTEAGNYKMSKVIEKLPPTFVQAGGMLDKGRIFQYANIPFHPTEIAASMEVLSNLYVYEIDKKYFHPIFREEFEKIIKEREAEFVKLFPDASFTLGDLRNKALYMKEVAPWRKQYIDLPSNEYEKQKNKLISLKTQFSNEYGKYAVDSLPPNGKNILQAISEAQEVVDAYKEVILQLNVTNILDMIDTFYFVRKEYLKELKDTQIELDKLDALITDLKERSLSATGKERHKLSFMLKIVSNSHWYLNKAFEIKKKVYDYTETTYKATVRGQLEEKALKEIQAKLQNPEEILFHIPKGSFTIPKYDGRRINPAIDYSQTLSTQIITKYLNDPSNPIGKTRSMVLLMDYIDVPVSPFSPEDALIMYVELVKKMSTIINTWDMAQKAPYLGTTQSITFLINSGVIKPYTESEEYVFYNYLFFKLLQLWKIEVNPRSTINVNTKDSTKDQIKKALEINAQITSFKETKLYDPKGFWLKALKQFYDNVSFNESMFVDINFLGSEGLYKVMKYGFIDLPDLKFIMDWSEYRNIMPSKAVLEIQVLVDKYRDSFIKYDYFNPEHGHTNYIYNIETFKDSFDKWSVAKAEILRSETTTLDELFKEYVSYLNYYNQYNTDEGWTGKFAYLFKADRERAELSGIQASFDELGYMDYEDLEFSETMDGFFSDAFNFVAKPVKKTLAVINKEIVSPITGELKKVLSPLEEAVLKPVGKTLEKAVYEVIPEKYVKDLATFTKMPLHLVQGKMNSKDFREAIRAGLRFNAYIVSGGKLGMKINQFTSKQIRQSLKNNEILNKLDLYSGGLLTSATNLHSMQREVAQGQKVDTLYILMRGIDALKVYTAVAGGAVLLGTTTAVNAVSAETNIGDSSIGRSALNVVGAGTAIYLEGGSKVTYKQAMKIASEKEAKTQASRVATREAIKNTSVGKSSIGRAAITIGISGTVNSIGTNTTVSEAIKKEAQAEAIRTSERKSNRQLKKIDENLDIKYLKMIYNNKDKDLAQIMADARDKFVEDVKSGLIKEKVIKEADRYVMREIKKKFDDTLGHYSDEMLMYLMGKYGPSWNYDYVTTPQDYIDFQLWLILYQQNPNMRILNIDYNRRKKVILAGMGLLAMTAVVALEG